MDSDDHLAPPPVKANYWSSSAKYMYSMSICMLTYKLSKIGQSDLVFGL